MIFERDGIRVEWYQDSLDGKKWYQITRKTASFTHVSFLHVSVERQNEADLLKLAKARFNVSRP